MEILIWVGTALALLGVAGLVYCVLIALKAKKEGLEGAALQTRLQKVVALNMAALGISAIGLMCVVLGIFLS
ncbi:MAG: hypothetical protein GKR98_07965 [Boseongicola sp.]|nr:MAG: hypothetical protein GKR98_07965 [Boseongicola sp.]